MICNEFIIIIKIGFSKIMVGHSTNFQTFRNRKFNTDKRYIQDIMFSINLGLFIYIFFLDIKPTKG